MKIIPLNVINSAAYFVKSRIKERYPELDLSLEYIEKEVARADRFIASLLEFSKPAESIRPIDLNILLDDTLLLLGKELSLSNIEITKAYTRDLPEIVADRGQLQQVFLNILLNACQAMPEGGRLKISSERLKVEDKEFVQIEALRNGAANYIMKPVNIEELKAALRNALGRQRLASENKGLLRDLMKAKEESEHWAYAVGVLYRLSENLRYRHDFKEIAEIALDHLNQAVDFHLAAILLLTTVGGKMVIKVNPDEDSSHIDRMTTIFLGEINGLVHREVRLENLAIDILRPNDIQKEGEGEVKASFTLPLVFNEAIIGGINITSLEKEVFREVDQKTIYAVASHTALAIEGHKRY